MCSYYVFLFLCVHFILINVTGMTKDIVTCICEQDFLESEGLVVNPSGELPTDPYIEKRKEAAALRTYQTPSAFDKTKQFLEMDRKVLRFYCVWDDRDNMFGEMRPYVIHVR